MKSWQDTWEDALHGSQGPSHFAITLRLTTSHLGFLQLLLNLAQLYLQEDRLRPAMCQLFQHN